MGPEQVGRAIEQRLLGGGRHRQGAPGAHQHLLGGLGLAHGLERVGEALHAAARGGPAPGEERQHPLGRQAGGHQPLGLVAQLRQAGPARPPVEERLRLGPGAAPRAQLVPEHDVLGHGAVGGGRGARLGPAPGAHQPDRSPEREPVEPGPGRRRRAIRRRRHGPRVGKRRHRARPRRHARGDGEREVGAEDLRARPGLGAALGPRLGADRGRRGGLGARAQRQRGGQDRRREAAGQVRRRGAAGGVRRREAATGRATKHGVPLSRSGPEAPSGADGAALPRPA